MRNHGSKAGLAVMYGYPRLSGCVAGLVGILCIAMLMGCAAVGPNYKEPQMEVPAQWSEMVPEGAITETTPGEFTRWWTLFEDPLLDSLIERAVSQNKDLQIAQARIREARARRGVVAADLLPTVGTSGTYARNRTSENIGVGPPLEQDFFETGFDANWEIDIFGGVRRSVEAADADIGASVESLRNVLVTLVSEVARNYLEMRGNQVRTLIAKENIKAQKHTLDMTQARFKVGLSSQLDIEQARAQLTATEAQVPGLETLIKQSIHRIGVLLGQPPGALIDALMVERPTTTALPQVPLGLPSDLLRRRPDIRQAERELAAATARIGVATADLFPRFFLTGALGLQSVELSNFLVAGSRFWSIGPTVNWPLFAGGRIRSNIEAQNARQEQALIFYEQVVLVSMEEVENALVAYTQEQATRRATAESVAANQRAVEISQALYKKGLTDFLNVLVNQRFLYQAQDALAVSEQKVSTNLVALFKALGGGWDVLDKEETRIPPARGTKHES
jgi:multidrug efflux system outer membrane protein